MDDEPSERDPRPGGRAGRTRGKQILDDIIKLAMIGNGFFCVGYTLLLGTNRDPLGLAAHHWVLLAVMGLVGFIYLGAS